jgi:hypothetical protein
VEIRKNEVFVRTERIDCLPAPRIGSYSERMLKSAHWSFFYFYPCLVAVENG